VHELDLPAPGAVARALRTLAWPLALLGKPSEIRLRGPNHCEGWPTFHDLRLGWVPLAAKFGLKVSVDLTLAGFGDDDGELVATLDPAPALTPLHLVHRGILRQVSIVAAVAGGRHEAALDAVEQVVRAMRRQGVIAEAERVPLPAAQGRGRWAITAMAEFEHCTVAFSALGLVLGSSDAAEAVAARLAHFLERRGAVDSATAEALLLPSFICAAGLGARAGTPPSCHYTAGALTAACFELAAIARHALAVRAVVDGAEGEEGVIVVAPA
jgi:RNA 3'-terminal phosphate cyclase